MSTFHQNHFIGFSPTLLSPSSTSNTTITNNQILAFDNSDQGSVDSDYTSLGSSKFYGNGGSTSSLHHQGRSQSFDELAITTTIPTRHFNGTLNVNKSTNDPLQFVKINPNHELIERAQEQLTLLESRKRLQENFKLKNNQTNNNNNNSNNKNIKSTGLNDDDADWSKAVENWRQKREQKRKQSTNSIRNEDEPTTPTSNNEITIPSPITRSDVFETKPRVSFVPAPTFVTSPPVVPPQPQPTITTTITNISNQIEQESPPPPRHKGPGRIHEIFIQKPIEVRGFGFKLDGGPTQNRPIYISTLEDGSPADKAGLCIDDEIISMNDENIQNMTFDQVRKILKERNLRGSIKLVVKTYEDIADDNSQTVTLQHSRTPSPQKPVSNLQSNTVSVSPISTTTTTTTSTIRLSSTIPTNTQSPVYTFLPGTTPPPIPSISSSNSKSESNSPTTSIQQVPSTASSTLNIFAPKPFRSTASINLDAPKSNETTTGTIEQQSPTVTQSTSQDVVKTTLSNPASVPSNSIDPPSPFSNKHKPPPPPLTSVDALLHGTSDLHINDQPLNDSPIAQVRSSVERQMSQLQQELLHGFPHRQSSREQRPVNIPIDLTHAVMQNSPTKTSPSIQQQDSNFNHNTPRSYGSKTNLYENTVHYIDPYKQQVQSSPNYENRPIQDISPIVEHNRPLSAQLSDRTINEVRLNISPPSTYQEQQKKMSIELDEIMPQQRMTSKQIHTTLNQVPKKTHYDDHSWINSDQKQSNIIPSAPSQPQVVPNHNERIGSARRTASQPSYNQAPNQLSMFPPGEDIYEPHPHHQHHHSRASQQQHQRDFESSNNRQHRQKNTTKSPIRTTINSNNNRVLSVSGKLRCSRCNDELGQGSAMVIESLGLYYHIECFRCFVCNIPLSSSFEGTDVRVRSNRLHCQNCFSDENGAWRPNV